ncbi:MAG: DNA repair protein RadA [Gammaproteobacteria bacterium]|jgi:DNA repair protein RadA/Sms
MTRVKVQFICSECGATTPKWTGQCPDCQNWNSLTESVIEKTNASKRIGTNTGRLPVSRTLDEVVTGDEARVSTGVSELDRVLGGGIVGGSVILIGGDPGIGKSTLLLQTMSSLAEIAGLSTLYISGEESLEQLSLRGKRLELKLGKLSTLTENQLEQILGVAAAEQPQVMVIDSIQTVFTEVLQSAPGSVAQIRECAGQLVRYAKQTNTAVILVGHVTKEGTLAGPRVLEHMVDTVLYFEGDSGDRYRVIRAVKNRFGAVNELGVFAMTDRGLREVTNPSAIFLSRHDENTSGSVVMVTREGTRPLLVEVQSLVNSTYGQQPKRVTVGLEQNRLAMLLAVLHRHADVITYDQDVFINVVGGVRISETSADLPIILSILSSLRNIPLARDIIVFGEIGLAGEIRPVQGGSDRLNEAVKHGFKRAIIPLANKPKHAIKGLEVLAVSRLVDALPFIQS